MRWAGFVVVVVHLVASLASGCAHEASSKSEAAARLPLELELHVTGLKQSERDLLQTKVCGFPEVEGCALTTKRDDTWLRFTYRGPLSALQAAVNGLPHPGLEMQRARATLDFKGWDNVPPTLERQAPRVDEVFTTSSIEVAYAIADLDVTEVAASDQRLAKGKDGVWRTTLKLKDGRHELEVRAKDAAGNEAKDPLILVIDTTPPKLTVEVKALTFDRAVVEGTTDPDAALSIDGKPVAVDREGRFSLQVPIEPDHPTVEVMAGDAYGNTTKLERSLKRAPKAKK